MTAVALAMTGGGAFAADCRDGAVEVTPAGISAAEIAQAEVRGSGSPGADMSVEVRRLQTRLMVAALSCGDRTAYNDFVLSYRPDLRRYGEALKAKFRREYGGGYQRHLDRFVTSLANQASQQSNVDRAAFCAGAEATFARLRDGRSIIDDLAAARAKLDLGSRGSQLACADTAR